jgi:hypothetical protein
VTVFSLYAEAVDLIEDGRRVVHVALGDAAGVELAYLGVGLDREYASVLLDADELAELVDALTNLHSSMTERP